MHPKRLLGVAAACALALAGCGGSSHHAATTVSHHSTTLTAVTGPSATSRCIPGNSFMGCSLPAPAVGITPRTAFPAGRRFVDVSDWQPSVNWRAVKASGIFAVVVKAGEGAAADPTYASHVAGARAAGLQVQAYWFVRPVGCSAEAAAIRRHVPAGMPLVLDIEVPGTSAYAGCLRSLAHAVYTSPGTWPGGSSAGLPLWQAQYASVLQPFFRPVEAWQFTESASVPGIGASDESVDYGLFAKPAPLLPVCFTHRISKSACAAAKRTVASDQRAAASTERASTARGCQVLSQRAIWFSTQLREHPKVNAVSRRRALALSRTAYAQRDCAVFVGRASYFTSAAAHVKATN